MVLKQQEDDALIMEYFQLLNFIFSAKAVKKEVHFVSLREALFSFIERQNLVLLLLFVGRRTP